MTSSEAGPPISVKFSTLLDSPKREKKEEEKQNPEESNDGLLPLFSSLSEEIEWVIQDDSLEETENLWKKHAEKQHSFFLPEVTREFGLIETGLFDPSCSNISFLQALQIVLEKDLSPLDESQTTPHPTTKPPASSPIPLPMVCSLKISSSDPACSLLELPTVIYSFLTLQKLCISSQRITSLSPSLSALRLLTHLLLPQNQLTSLPAELKGVVALEWVDVSENRLVSLPNVGGWVNLKGLRMQKNSIEKLPEGLGNLTSLKTLVCYSNAITQLPKELSKLTQLEFLDVSNNPFFSTIPQGDIRHTTQTREFSEILSGLVNLRWLNGFEMGLTLLTSSVGCVVEMESLKLFGNKLHRLPPELGRMGSLKELVLFGNSLAFVPKSLERLTNLTHLVLSWNEIDDLPPPLASLPCLERLDLSHNQISDPTQIAPIGLSGSHSLKSINVSHNRLTSLPAELNTLENLKVLNASHNKISSLPPTLFNKSMKSLTHFLLANNALRSLPESIQEVKESLVYLDLEENGFVYLPNSLAFLGRLESLKLTSSKMTVVPHSLPPSLRFLTLVRMDIDADSEVICKFQENEAGTLHFQLLVSLLRSYPHHLIVLALLFCSKDPTHRRHIIRAGGMGALLQLVKDLKSTPSSPKKKSEREGKEESEDSGLVRFLAAKSLANLAVDTVHYSDFPLNDHHLVSLLSLLFSSPVPSSGKKERGVSSKSSSTPLDPKQLDDQTKAEIIRCVGNVALSRTFRKKILTLAGVKNFLQLHKMSETEEIVKETHRLLIILGDTHHILSPLVPALAKRKVGKRGVRILALDGGGIRALVSLSLLSAIEKHTGKRITELFDFVACTSTGAILATMAFVKKFPLRACSEKYKEFGKKVFASQTGDKDVMRSDSSWTKFMNYVNWMSSGGVYKAEDFVAALHEVCGGEKMIDHCRDVAIPWLVFVAASIQYNPPQPFLYRNYNLPLDSPSRYAGVCHMDIDCALRSTTAAPGYFDEFTTDKLPGERQADGGLLHNNPSGVALHECMRLFGVDQKIACFLNVGTGRPPVATTPNTGLKCILNALVKSASSSEKSAEILQDSLHLAGIPFYSLNPVNPVFDVGILELREEVLKEMEDQVHQFVQEQAPLIAQICSHLVD